MAMSLSGDNLALNASRFAPTLNAATAPSANAPKTSIASDSLSLSGSLTANAPTSNGAGPWMTPSATLVNTPSLNATAPAANAATPAANAVAAAADKVSSIENDLANTDLATAESQDAGITTAEVAPAAAATAASENTYTVVTGDTLSQIAQSKLGDESRWPEIADLNKDQIDNPDLIFPGQVLKMPADATAAAPASNEDDTVDSLPTTADDVAVASVPRASTAGATAAAAAPVAASTSPIQKPVAAVQGSVCPTTTLTCKGDMQSRMELLKLRQQLAQVERELDSMIQQSGNKPAPNCPWMNDPGRRPQYWMDSTTSNPTPSTLLRSGALAAIR
jgi:LysM repeat protein